MSAEIVALHPQSKAKDDTLFKRDATYPFLYLHTETQYWYVRKFFSKEKIPTLFKTTKHKKKGKARAAAELMIQEWRNFHLGIEDHGTFKSGVIQTQGKLISVICDEVLANHTPEQRIQTRKQHKLYIPRIKEECGHMGINAYSVEMFNAWIERERKTPNPRTGKLRKTFVNYAKHMNLVWTFAYQRKDAKTLLRFPNPDKRIRRELEEKPRKALTALEKEILELKSSRCYTTAEIEAIWPHLNDTWRLRLVLSLDCIMRFMEAGKLEWNRVNLETGLITLRPQDVKTGTKTGKGRSFYISARALALLRRRRAGEWDHGKGEKHQPDSPFVFPNFRDPLRPASDNQRIWNEAKAIAGIKGRARWHDLRHTALSFALLGDPSLPEHERKKMRREPLLVSEYAGVSMAVIQQVYLHTEAEHTRGVPGAFSHLNLDCELHTKSTPNREKTSNDAK